MKKFYTITAVLVILAASHLKANHWTQKSSLSGNESIRRFAFSINDKGYIGSGTKYDSIGQVVFADVWMYDPVADSWTQKADFGGGPRYWGTGFAVNNKGYAGFGISPPGIPMYDLWEYDPGLNQWIQKNTLAQTFFDQPPAGFATGNYGYIFARAAGGISRLWQYNPVSDSWTQKTTCPVSRADVVAFSIGNSGYVGMGYDLSSTLSNFFYRYDELTDTWTQAASFPGVARWSPICFSISGKGFLGLGHGPTWPLYYTDFWQYDPVTDSWAQAASYSGVPREDATCFSTSTKGYAGFGCEFLTFPYLYFSDFWEYTPGGVTGIAETASSRNFSFSISPNVCSDFCHIQFYNSSGKNVELFITDLHGRLFMKKEYTGLTFIDEKIQVSGLAAGEYIARLNDGKDRVSQKFIKVR